MEIKTLLSFDYGTKNIGIATGQTITRSASALTHIKAKDGIPNWGEVSALLKEWQPDLVLVGLPLNMDGTESDFCLRARKFAQRLHGRFGVQVELVDERLSTRQAKQEAALNNRHRDYKNNPVDAIAAQIILQDWLNKQVNA